uniref:Uncharacterized protein n=1 Tax=Rhizophora mucronata TaxID=61149 RepID=A0A2P2P4A3_RHIMU
MLPLACKCTYFFKNTKKQQYQ